MVMVHHEAGVLFVTIWDSTMEVGMGLFRMEDQLLA
ncbi:MAG: hypothetical protein LZF60_160151 [Nitrospira sp.]|nr:MAG: hypothetical protein LZF60_160151 [Nitrospira sp.]